MSDNFDPTLRYFNNKRDFDVEGHATKVVSLGVVQSGGLLDQTQEYIQHTRHNHRLTTTNAAASTSVTGIDDVRQFSVQEVVNYVTLQPSIRNNAFILSLRRIEFFNIGGTFYAVGDFIAQSGQPTAIYRIPTQRNFLLYLYVIPPTGYAAPYSDIINFSVGYLPDGLEKVAISDG